MLPYAKVNFVIFLPANVDDITLTERFDTYQANADMYDRFER